MQTSRVHEQTQGRTTKHVTVKKSHHNGKLCFCAHDFAQRANDGKFHARPHSESIVCTLEESDIPWLCVYSQLRHLLNAYAGAATISKIEGSKAISTVMITYAI